MTGTCDEILEGRNAEGHPSSGVVAIPLAPGDERRPLVDRQSWTNGQRLEFEGKPPQVVESRKEPVLASDGCGAVEKQRSWEAMLAKAQAWPGASQQGRRPHGSSDMHVRVQLQPRDEIDARLMALKKARVQAHLPRHAGLYKGSSSEQQLMPGADGGPTSPTRVSDSLRLRAEYVHRPEHGRGTKHIVRYANTQRKLRIARLWLCLRTRMCIFVCMCVCVCVCVCACA
jgi:hypothetical protein